MKKFYLLYFLAATGLCFGQNYLSETEAIAESEMKSASALMEVEINPNTQNYDVTYHKLEWTVNPAVYFISGKVTTTYKALSSMSTITFDLTSQLNVTSVKKNNVSLAFFQNENNELVITLPSVQASGTSATLEIIYSGEPAFDEQAFTTDTHNGVPVIYTLSEPFGARDWWPCKQDLNDKINSIDVFITAPSQYVSVSNGLEQSQVINGGNKTTHFHHGYPIPAYLIALAVTNYSVFTQSAGTAPDEFPIVNYIYPENLASVQSQLAQTLPIMDIYESTIETYPFSDEKYGHAQFGWGGGMEHTTVSFMGSFGRSLIAHELGHQWFGDKVTCGSWRDIWLNEGFAEYMSGIVVENLDGEAAFIDWRDGKIENITSQPGGAVYLNESEATNVNRIFSNRLTYNKGSMVAHMLRFKLGDEDFFQGLRNYLDDPDHAYGYALTPDLEAHLEAASGMDLTEFFNDWVYRQGFPTYNITAHNVSAGQVQFTVNQEQSHFSVSFFEMPVPVRVFGASGQQMDLVLNNTSNNQTIMMSVPFAVTSVQFDPERHIISSGSTALLSADQFNLIESMALFPNPASATLSVSLPTGLNLKSSVVRNVLGQTELRSGNETTWNVSSLPSGIHFISLETDHGTKTLRFIKE
ncbi:MAG TPA: M1 family aminopeptidase [Flavobacterium sp.]|jgi:aminopeptidase N